MTNNMILQIGDNVVFNVDPGTRNWTKTYDGIPDGTRGIVCGFYDAVIYEPRVPVLVHQPGVYHRRGAVSVWLPNGRIVPGEYCVDMVDKEEEKRRNAALRDADGILRTPQVRLGNLPDTKFWEQDRVLVRFPHNGSVQEMVIGAIDYQNMHNRRADGSPWPFYRVNSSEGMSISAEESWMELIKRGNVWRYYHKEQLSFANLKEEAGFFQLIGHAKEMRNPKNNLYSWTEAEVLDAIKAGTVHGFLASSGFFGSGPHISAVCFNDKYLGQRVARATLEGFDMG